jgi:inosose dehydratase
MNAIQFGCQAYTWQMSGEKYVGAMPHILDTVQSAGFAGFETEVCMLGDYYKDSHQLASEHRERGLALGALTLVCDWAGPEETEDERAAADKLLDYMERLPGTHLVLCQMPGADRENLVERQRNAIACKNAVAMRAVDSGLTCSCHPNSPPGSIFRTEEDYRILLEGLDDKLIGFAPDAGHIANGGMDVQAIFQEYRSLIRHVHFKDISEEGEWAAMGKGVIDFPAIVMNLRDTGYAGWIMVEEESKRAETEPDAVTLENGEHLKNVLLPLLAG